MKLLNSISILVLGIAIGCAQAPKTPAQVAYQSKSSKVLGSLASSVSRGFGASKKSSSTRKFYDYGSPDQSALYSRWNQRNGNYVMKRQLRQEAEDCKNLVKDIPKDCNNLGFMASSLARCLDRVITHQNPLMGYSYNQLDTQGQQYYTYLYDWRRPRNIQYYSLQDAQYLNPYGHTGWIPGDLTYP